MNIKNIITIIFTSFLASVLCVEKQKSQFPFFKGGRKEFVDNIIKEWAQEHKFSVIYTTSSTAGKFKRTRTIYTGKGDFKCMTHLAKVYTDIEVPCTYCLKKKTLIKGTDYQVHHVTYHAQGKSIKPTKVSSLSPVMSDKSQNTFLEESTCDVKPLDVLCLVAAATALLEK